MKKIYFLLIALILINSAQAQNFTWIKGNTSFSLAGVYGTQNVPAAPNNPGGRHGAAKWTDAAGNLWLFGGEGYSNNTTLCWMNDLWKFDITTHQWVWIRGSNGPNALSVYGTQGIPAASNEPGAREFAASWTDAAGNFWLFGGDGFGTTLTANAQRMGDLWKYNPTTNEWTWMHGFTTSQQTGVYGTLGVSAPSNMPGGRYGTCPWTDAAGNLWMFGGRGLASALPQGDMNDIWKYTIATNEWTWMGGNNTPNHMGLYGSLSVPSTANLPGSRYFASGWTDATGNFYLFGGHGYSTANFGYLNDLWKFDPVANTWTWLNGSSGFNALGVYGTQGTSSPANVVGGRYSSAAWKDNAGKFWVFGGLGFSTVLMANDLNDLWKYDPATNEWTWMKGATVGDQNGNYGTQGVAAATNIPGGRMYNTWWKSNGNTLWLLGGLGYDATSTFDDNMDDLWMYKIPCSSLDSITSSPGKVICSGSSVTLTAVNSGAAGINWYNSPTSATSISTGTTFSIPTPTTANTQTVISYYADEINCTNNPRPSITLTVNPLPIVQATSTKTTVCRNVDYATLTATGANTYTWDSTPVVNTNTLLFNPNIPLGTYTFVVTGTDLSGCTNTASIKIKVSICPGIKEINPQNLVLSLFPNPNTGEFTIKSEENFTKADFIITNTIGQKVFQQVLSSNETFIKPNLSKGLYYYEIKLDDNRKASGKVLIE